MGDYEPLELRAIETCCQCNAGTACKQHELHLSTVRENWSKCGGSLAGYRRRLPDRCEVPWGFRGLRWFLLPEGTLHSQDHLQPLQHRDQQEDRSLRLRFQEGHWRCERDT